MRKKNLGKILIDLCLSGKAVKSPHHDSKVH